MSLDTLYGPGTKEALEERLGIKAIVPGAVFSVTEFSENPQTSHVEITWKDTNAAGAFIARWKLEFYAERVHGSELTVAAAYRNKGLYRALILKQPRWWKEVGLKIHTASPASPRSEYILALGGFHWLEWEGQELFGTFIRPDGRMLEYREWVAAGSPPLSEPVWHIELVANPVGVGEVF